MISAYFHTLEKNEIMDIATKVKLLREDKKISQEFISQELGLSQSQYSRRENGEVSL